MSSPSATVVWSASGRRSSRPVEPGEAVASTQDALYPAYGFRSHVGYITPGHSAVVREIGPSEIHRRSFNALCYA